MVGKRVVGKRGASQHDDGDVYDYADTDGNLRKASQEEWWPGQARLLGKPPPTLSAHFSLALAFVFVFVHCTLTENHF